MIPPIVTSYSTKEKIQDRVESLFPTADKILDAFRIQTPVNQRQYLIDGELRYWDGDDQIEIVYKIVRHLAANQRGVNLQGDRAKPSILLVSAQQENVYLEVAL
jgi:hypothetical protein